MTVLRLPNFAALGGKTAATMAFIAHQATLFAPENLLCDHILSAMVAKRE